VTLFKVSILECILSMILVLLSDRIIFPIYVVDVAAYVQCIFEITCNALTIILNSALVANLFNLCVKKIRSTFTGIS